MSLKVTDLKVGDVVRMDCEVVSSDCGLRLRPMERLIEWKPTDADLAAANAELVRRPRPVRKGDEIKPESAPTTVTFLATWESEVVVWRDGYGCDLYGQKYVTHADGCPIDWEASE